MTSPATCQESALRLHCAGDTLQGVLAMPLESSALQRTGVVVVVGGPQYRAGSHRQFVLLARWLAQHGYPVLRFDVRGMGDSTGDARSFEALDADIAAAVDGLHRAVPSLHGTVLWGLCDGASAGLLYLHARQDARIRGLCLLNPWVRSPQGLARTQIRHYYGARLLQPAFWRKLLGGGVGLRAVCELFATLRQAAAPAARPAVSYQQRMASAWRNFPGAILVLLSEHDLTAQEFLDHARTATDWAGLMEQPSVRKHLLAGADHTLSQPACRQDMEHAVLAWLRRTLG